MNSVIYDNNLPAHYSSHYAPLLSPYQKIFIGGSNAPAQVVANQQYHVSFLSPKPGPAAQDNAELTISHSKEECWLFCSSGAYCHIHTSPFSLTPIPGRIDWAPVAQRCAEWSHWFLPLLRQ